MTPEENDLLCRVEGDAPMGQIMRRHWIAACLSEEVAEPDGAPVRVRCSARTSWCSATPRAGSACSTNTARIAAPRSLYARNEECGLRCLYHGWKFDVEGNVVEMASEPAESNIPQRVKHKAYPAREAGGFVWCYMGPADEMPEFEPPAFAPTPDARVSATKVRVRCNWAQILEGQIDSAHSLEPAFLRHGAGAGRRREGDRRRTGCGPRPTRRRASRSSAPATASATRRSAARS